MYHTFQAATGPMSGSETDGIKPETHAASRRISTSNACLECRRRKIRCDGTQPCGQCQWYQHPKICTYTKPTQRVVPSRKLVDKLQSQVDHYKSVVTQLFPGQDLEALVELPREDLISLALTLLAPSTSPTTNTDPLSTSTGQEQGSQVSDGPESLEALEQAPEQDPEYDEAKKHRDKIQAISDDVNGLSLSVERQSSYVGVSSIPAALRVIFRVAPMARPFAVQIYNETALPSRASSPPPSLRDIESDYLPPPDVGHKLIESYFAHVHVLMPMIDEEQFWHVYLYNQRRDYPWLALLNMVLALGSLAGSTCDNEDHITYFQRARRHLDLETFGSGNLLVLQTLGLMSGYYLHWLNRPNEANCLMGATLRMALALGLHREFGGDQTQRTSTTQTMRTGAEIPAEIRRRTWWSLFCLDVWASMGTGRPSPGRLGAGITVQSPKIPEQMNNAQHLASLRLLPIIHNIEFCKLASRIHDVMVARPLCKFDELFALDAELVKWHDELPPMLRDIDDGEKSSLERRTSSSSARPTLTRARTSSFASSHSVFDFSQPPDRDKVACPEVLKTPRTIILWRYQNLRILMHRPYLLSTALRRVTDARMTAEERLAVSRCRAIAGQCIADIDRTCQNELIAGWNAVWFMYQAVMVPLLSLFSHLTTPVEGTSPGQTAEASQSAKINAAKWERQIETAVAFFERMRQYSVAASKSKDVVQRLHEASKSIRSYTNAHNTQIVSPKQPPRPHAETTIQPANGMSVPASSDPSFGYSREWVMYPQATDIALDSFWDDMMWEDFPEMERDVSSWIPGFDELRG